MLTVQDAEQVIDDLDALEARLAAHFEMLMVFPLSKPRGNIFLSFFCHISSHIFMFCHGLSVNPCQETITAGGKLKVSFWLGAQS